MNGDGKAETIQFKFGKAQYDGEYKISIVINGRHETILKNSYGGSTFFELNYLFFKLKNGKRFIYVNPTLEDMDGPQLIYQYKSGKLKKVCDFEKSTNMLCRWTNKIIVDGNSIKVKMQDSGTGAVGFCDFSSVYSFKNGRFVLT